MPNSRKLRAGRGAQATILTKYIRPPQHVPNQRHRSDIVLLDRKENNYEFCYLHENETGNDNFVLMTGPCRFVKVIKEGELMHLFDKIYKEPSIPWADSKAKKILYKDLMEGAIPIDSRDENGRSTMSLKDIYSLHPEFSEYHYNKFSSRLSSLRKTIKSSNQRANADQEAFELFLENNPISYLSHKGYIQWQGSEQQRLLKKDIEDGIVHDFGRRKKELWESRDEYQAFPLHVFRDKIKQEIGTEKYLYTLKARGKDATYKYA